ncbi:monosaccharide ABC transporter ATP-binding protein (CUT2 family) [Pacificibacter maritimus]|uniref:Monosaccharide ABC transporter ATP-binding protein (CUT2 family) n=1 Tax=Pacificibacter maritimus TaxID=762213 RepID=A0A3N4U8N1_9RHOB|nr:sugar ABC transporter ATP-binding protein [Pacificibacter maritimus]RPE63329.1 monosaccharide ABC transporter ATP-binding protein (CUT2 family) [Pacificibacter maritimus]
MQSVTQLIPDLLCVSDLKKHFGGVKALDGVDLNVRQGEVHALVGENGAGKSTLIKVLTGIHMPTDGQISFAGKPFDAGSPHASKDVGIQVVHQEFNLLEHLSIAENISIEDLPTSRWGLLNRTEMRSRAVVAIAAVGLDGVNVNRPVSSLGIAHRQLIEIARSLQSDSKLLILDEPTATLTEREKVKLFKIIQNVKEQGVSVLFVSHHLDEVFQICDRVTVFRNGKTVITQDIDQTSPSEVVSHMVGRHVDHTDASAAQAVPFGPIALRTKELKTIANRSEQGVSIAVQSGEILGIAGLVGAGRTEFLRAIFAADKSNGGTVYIKEKQVKFRGPRDAIDAGIGFVTEDRKDEGLILQMPISMNISMVNLKKLFRTGLIRHFAEHHQAVKYGDNLQMKYGKTADAAASLSGGNQQKIVLAKWLASKPAVLLLDEPTRGVDVGAKFEIYGILRALAAEGVAMIVVSSELPELMTLSDRIAVMADHKISGVLTRSEYSEERILQLAYGQTVEQRVAQ